MGLKKRTWPANTRLAAVTSSFIRLTMPRTARARFVKRKSHLGGSHSAAPALQERRTHLALKRMNVAADGGLTQLQVAGSSAHRTAINYCHKAAKLAQVHEWKFSKTRR